MSSTNSTRQSVPRQDAGKWIAWNHDLTNIIASGNSPQEVRDAALATGETKPVLAKSPPAEVRFIGVRSR